MLVSERIPETGIHTPDSKYFGRMQDIQEIGDSLFACGDGLQFYRRSRYGDGTWHWWEMSARPSCRETRPTDLNHMP
jgi:hypothetical protein